ncbi:MAG: PhoU domain-containing protein [Candidatus Omnitrophota bacterium]|nr:PhoU domain-containing protein [Candidatus Omnitrophota bacterium]
MDIKEIWTKIILMADKVHGSLLLIEKGFMANKLEPLAEAIKEEHLVNEMEKILSKSVIEISKQSTGADERKELALMGQIVETVERMGDEATNLIERIEIKVVEKLLFSDLGVQEFNETFGAMKRSVEMMIEFLKKRDPALKDRIIDNGFHVKELVERYRKEHFERLVQGVCTPMAANMYFDMLDFTGNLARHSSSIVKLF